MSDYDQLGYAVVDPEGYFVATVEGYARGEGSRSPRLMDRLSAQRLADACVETWETAVWVVEVTRIEPLRAPEKE